MKLWMQLSDVDEPTGSGVAIVSINLEEIDLHRTFRDFSEMFLQPAMAQLKQIRENNQKEMRINGD